MKIYRYLFLYFFSLSAVLLYYISFEEKQFERSFYENTIAHSYNISYDISEAFANNSLNKLISKLNSFTASSKQFQNIQIVDSDCKPLINLFEGSNNNLTCNIPIINELTPSKLLHTSEAKTLFYDPIQKKKVQIIFQLNDGAISETKYKVIYIPLLSLLAIFLFFIIVGIWLVKNYVTRPLLLNEQKLEKQYNLINTIIDTVPVRIFWKDLDGVYLGANKAFIQDAQLEDVSQIIGKTDFDMTWRKDAERFRSDDAEVTNSGIPWLQYEEEQPKEDGSVIYLVTSKVPLQDTNGNTIGILGVYNDITELKTLQKEAKEKDIRLLAQSRLAQMGEMISMIAHQWRQPLSSISAIAIAMQLKMETNSFDLQTKKGQDEQKEYMNKQLKTLEDNIHNLSETINDFRNFYKPNQKMTKKKYETVIKSSMSIIEASIKSNNIELIYDFNSDEAIEMYDREIMQVVLNLLKNAQDCINERKIENPFIKISTIGKTISICDNAGGIADDVIDKIFDPYFTTKGEKNGTGLGLYMSKKIIEEHHNGELLVENIDDGVCFIINLS